jgi:hypothetical protein
MTIRRLANGALSLVMARPVLRLTLGRWPTAAEVASFRDGFVDDGRSDPALARALLAVPVVASNIRRSLRAQPLPAPASEPLPPTRRRAVAVLHIEKTAGTSLAVYLAELFPGSSPIDSYDNIPAHLFQPLPVDAATTPLLRGHLDLPALRRMGGSRFTILLLREPRARLLSLYRYLRSMDPASLPEHLRHYCLQAAHESGLLEYLNHPSSEVQDFISNIYVRRLTGLYATGATRDPLEEDGEGALAAAIEALNGIEFVGVVEQMELSMNRLAAALGRPPLAEIPRENVLANLQAKPGGGFQQHQVESVTPEVEAALERHTRFDSLIYRLALRRLAAA